MTPKSARKMRRRLDNDALEKDARFWKSKTIFSSSEIFRPANKSAAAIVDGKWERYQGGSDVSVYLYRIKTKGHEEEFLKIGITNSLAFRFELDVVRYKFNLQNSVDGLTRKEALEIERGLHEILSQWSYVPKFGFVSGGHTECFVDCDMVIETANKVFRLVEEEKELIGRKRPRPRIGHSAESEDEHVKAQEVRDRVEKDRALCRTETAITEMQNSVDRRRNRHRRFPPKKIQAGIAQR